MSRINYSDDWDDLRFGRWLGCLRSTLLGKRGQQALALLEAELERMSYTELLGGALCEEVENRYMDRYMVCTLGALAHSQGITYNELLAVSQAGDEDEYPADKLARWAEQNLNVSQALAYLLQEINDEEFDRHFSPEQRYRGMLAWVKRARAEPLTVWREYRNARIP